MRRHDHRRAHRLLGAAAASILTLPLVSCGVGAGGSGSLAAMLDQVPDTPANRSQIFWTDITTARDEAGIKLPTGTLKNRSPYLKLFIPKAGAKVIAAWPQFMDLRAGGVEHWQSEVGFTVGDVDQSLDVGVPPDTYAVAAGRFDPDRVKQAVSSDPLWKDDVKSADHRGVSYWRWLDDGELDAERISATHPLGNSVRLQVDDDQIRWSRTDKEMNAGIDLSKAGGRSLADVDELRLIAKALDKRNVYRAFLTATSDAFRVDAVPVSRPEIEKQLAAAALDPWTAIGVGDAADDHAAVGILVLTHDDEKAAKANLERLRKLLKDGLSARGDKYRDLYDLRSLEREKTTVIMTVKERLPTDLTNEVGFDHGLVLHR